MELIILAAIVLIWLIFSYEFIESNPKKVSKILTADEASSTQDEINRARSILKTIKSPENKETKEETQNSEEVEEILPDPFSEK